MDLSEAQVGCREAATLIRAGRAALVVSLQAAVVVPAASMAGAGVVVTEALVVEEAGAEGGRPGEALATQAFGEELEVLVGAW